MSTTLACTARFLSALFCAACGLSSAHAQTETQAAPHDRRVALVIGNAAYKNARLANPVNDARAIAGRLRSLGFDVMLRENLVTREIGGVYREFRSKIVPGSVALVFYAGHGVQIKGQNYFPAVDSDITSEEDVPLQSLNLATLLDSMDEAKAGVSLVFLDACRDNPFSRRFRSSSRGLAKVEAASGTLIHYATKPGSVADDGLGQHGTYTEALLAQMGQPGMPVELMLKQVTNRVVATTKGRQEPWVEGSLRGDFYFVAGGPAPGGIASAAVVPASLAPKTLPAARGSSANPFDGNWVVAITCPAHKNAGSYAFELHAKVKESNFKADKGVEGEPNWLRIEGHIQSDGIARLEAKGITGNPDRTVGSKARGTAFDYPISAQFEESRGTGRRLKARPCDLAFSKY